jgi:uncharacterized membrane protein YeaQ/YmgE (transglycosylase-associated protein family)
LPGIERGDRSGMGEIIVLIILGLIVGALGRLVNPGRDPMPIWLTILIGIGAVLIVGLILPNDWEVIRFIVAVIVAAVLVTIVGRFWGGRRAVTAP